MKPCRLWLFALAPLLAAFAGRAPAEQPARTVVAGPDSACRRYEAQGRPRGHSVAVTDATTGELKGSATHLCSISLYDPSGYSYFVTASHVIEGSDRIAVPQAPFCLWFNDVLYETQRAPLVAELGYVDSSKDLAFFKLRTNSLTALGCLSLPLADRFAYPVAYDFDSAVGLPPRTLAIEAVDPRTLEVTRRDFIGTVATSASDGLPGRDGTGRLLMVKGDRAVAGNSGGAVVETSPSLVEGLAPRERLVGVMLAFDRGGRPQMALLDANVVLDHLMQFYRLSREPSRRLERGAPGGVEYLSARDGSVVAKHFRGGPFASQPGGRGPGRLGDGGAERMSPARGPGRLGDGGSPSPFRGQWTSGVELAREPGKRWLSIGDYWSEGEAFPLARRSELESGVALAGVYEDAGGGLRATSAAAPLPTLYRDPYASSAAACRQTQAVLRATANSATRVIDVIVCARRDENESMFALSSGGGRPGYEVRLKRGACGGECAVEASAREVELPSGPTQLRQIESILFSPRPRRQAGRAMARDGIRTYWSDAPGPRRCLQVDETSGFKLIFGACDDANAGSISGPASR